MVVETWIIWTRRDTGLQCYGIMGRGKKLGPGLRKLTWLCGWVPGRGMASIQYTVFKGVMKAA